MAEPLPRCECPYCVIHPDCIEIEDGVFERIPFAKRVCDYAATVMVLSLDPDVAMVRMCEDCCEIAISSGKYFAATTIFHL